MKAKAKFRFGAQATVMQLKRDIIGIAGEYLCISGNEAEVFSKETLEKFFILAQGEKPQQKASTTKNSQGLHKSAHSLWPNL